MEATCFVCQTKKDVNYNFSCAHAYCVHCLYHHIFVNHIQELANTDSLRVICKCRGKGTLSLSMNQIQELLRQKIELDQNDNTKDYCHIHDKVDNSLYCKNCQRPICKMCSESSEHFQHEISDVEDYLKKVRLFLADLPLEYKNLESFLENFDDLAKKFKDDMEEDFSNTIRTIDELIKNLNNLKIQYAKVIKENLGKGIQLMKIIKLFYCGFYIEYNKKETCKDVYVLKYLKDINYEFYKLKLIHNNEMIEKLKSIKLQSDELAQTKANLLDLNLYFKDIPRNYNKLYSLYEHTKSINCVIQLKNGALATGSGDYSIRFWEIQGGEFKNTKIINELTGNVIFLYQLRDGRLVSTARDNNVVKIWDIMSQTTKGANNAKISCELTLSGHKESVTSLLQLPDERIITASRDKTLGVWSPVGRSFQQVETLIEHTEGVFCVCELPWGRIASGSDDTTIRIWENKDEKYKCIHILGGHTKGVRALCQLKDGRLGSASEDHTIRIWNIEGDNFSCLQSITAHHKGITCLIQIADERLVTASKDGSVRIFIDTQRGFVANEKLKVHTNVVFSVIQLNDGKLASSGADNQVVIWKCGKMYD